MRLKTLVICAAATLSVATSGHAATVIDANSDATFTLAAMPETRATATTATASVSATAAAAQSNVAAASTAASATTASAQAFDQNRYRRPSLGAMKWELTYLALSAVDTAQTVRCLKRQMCTEGNPLFGRNPKAGTLILAKAGGGLAHFLLFKSIMRRNPTVAKRVAQVSVGLQSGIVLWNARLGL